MLDLIFQIYKNLNDLTLQNMQAFTTLSDLLHGRGSILLFVRGVGVNKNNDNNNQCNCSILLAIHGMAHS